MRRRLGSYLAATGGDLAPAIDLFDWNAPVGGALHEDIGRLEVVLRNALDADLVGHGVAKGWTNAWYRRPQLVPDRYGARAIDDNRTARQRATRRGAAEVYGKVIAEVTFGFWRFLCTSPYLTSIWVPALAQAFRTT